ncbi:MAG: tyrosine-type recombinase/integrase [Gemmatimonadota bacterium]
MATHPGSIDRHGTEWRIRLCVGGKRHTFKMDGDRPREDVEQEARERDTDLRRRNGKGLPGPMPFSELLSRYLESEVPQLAPNSKKSYRTSLLAFSTYFVDEGGDLPAHEIRPGHIHGFMTWRRTHAPNGSKLRKPVSARTVAKDRVVLHIVFALGETLEIVDANPVRKTKAPKGDKREPLILTGDQYEALLRACEGRPMLALYSLLLGETGVRCDSEGLWLRWQDADLERGFIDVVSGGAKGQRTKSGKSRKVPMTNRLRAAMREHMATYRLRTYHGQRSPWVFHHEVDRRHAKAGERLTGLRRAFGNAAARAELPTDLRQHDLRHRRVTTWLQEGHDISRVQKAMGHSSVRVTEGYTHLIDQDLLSLVVDRGEEELRALVGT